MKVGLHEDYPAADSKARFPEITYAREFVDSETIVPKSMIPGFTWYAKPHWDAGVIPIVSFRPKPADVASGAWDPYFRELGTWLKTKPETLVIIWHEPEESMTGNTYRTMFSRARNNLKETFPELRVGTSAMGYQWNAKWNDPNLSVAGKTDKAAEWRVQADFYGVDIYSGFEYPINTILPEISGFQRWLRLFVPFGSPVFITERGFKTQGPADDPIRAAAIAREREWLMSSDAVANRIEAYCYWSSTGVENDPLMVLDPTGQVALKTLFDAVTMLPVDRYDEGYNAGHQAGLETGWANAITSVKNAMDLLEPQEG